MGVRQAKLGTSEAESEYRTLQEFFDDVMLVFSNCIKYTSAHEEYMVGWLSGILWMPLALFPSALSRAQLAWGSSP
jgi:hypothetical protein